LPNALLPYCEVTFQDPASLDYFTIKSDEHDFEAEVSGDNSGKPTHGVLHLPNLTDQTLARINRGTKVYVRMGYRDGDSATVLTGTVVFKDKPTVSGADLISDVYVRDDLDRLSTTYLHVTFINRSPEHIVRTLMLMAGIPLGQVDATGVIVPRFISGAKNAFETVQDILRAFPVPRMKFHLRDGHAIFVRYETGIATAILLTPDTGLKTANPVIGDVEKQDETDASAVDVQGVDDRATSTTTVKRDVDLDCILTPQLQADSLAAIRAKKAQGIYRVKNFTHKYSPDGSGTQATATPDLVLTDAQLRIVPKV